MVADPIGTYLQSSLSKHSSNGSQSAILQTKLQASAKRALLTRVEFEPAERQHSHMLQSLQNKYIVLGERDYAPTNGSTNGSTNGASNGASNGAANGGGSGAASSGRPQAPVSLSKKAELKLGWGNSSYPNGAGMVNMGNTCYLNSSLQALFHAPGLVRWLLEDGRHAARCTGGDQCTVCSMARTLRSTHQRQGGVVKPILIYSKLKLICKHFIHGRQEDAHEFVRHLLDSMQRCHLAALRATKLDSLSKETTPLNHLFGGYLKTQVTCLRCQHASRTFQHFQDLLVDVRQVSTVDDALHLYFKKERLDGADYKCEKCRMKVPATKKFFIDEAPLILCIQLKRFSLGGGKITKHLAFPNKLNVTRFMTRPPTQGQVVYTLVSLINHMGPSQNCGHYTAMAKASNGQVYLFDDASVRMTSLSNMLSTNAYVLMYEMTGSTRQLLLGNPPGTPATETSRPPSPPPPPPPPPVQPARGPTAPAVPASPLQQGAALTNTANRSRISFTMTAPAIVVKRPMPGNKSAVLGRTVPIATATSTSATSTVTSTAASVTGAASGGVAATVTALKAAVTKGPLVPYGTGDSGSDDDSDAENRAVRPPSKKASTAPTTASATALASASSGAAGVATGASTVAGPTVVRRPSLTPPRVLTERQPRAPAATSPWTVRETAALASPSLNSEESVGSHGSVGCTSPWLVTEKEGGPTPAPRPVGAAVPPGWKVTPLPARSPQSDSFDPRPENRHTPPPVRRAGSVDSPDGPRHLLGKISRKLKSLAPRAEKRQLGEDVGRPAKRPRPAPGPATAPGAGAGGGGGDGEGRKVGNSVFFDMEESSAATTTSTTNGSSAAAVPPPPRPPGRSMPVVTEEGAIRHLSGSDTVPVRQTSRDDAAEGATTKTAGVKGLKGAGDGGVVTAAEAGGASKSNGNAHKDSHKDSLKESYDSQKESQKESHKRKKEKSRERDSISERGDGASHGNRATSADIFSPSKERSKSAERSKSSERSKSAERSMKSSERSSKSSERSTKSSERSSKSADPDRPSAASTGLKSPHPHRPAASDPTASTASTSAVASGQGGQWPDRPAARRHHDRHYRRRSRSSSESSSEDDRRRRPSSAPAASVLSHGSHGSHGSGNGSHSGGGGGGSGDALAYLTSGAGLAGYGRGVTTWSGERPGLEREREREREERRRREELDDYNDEFDSGRVKKVRSYRERPSLDHNPFQRLQEERRHGNRRDRSPSSDRRRERHERRRRRDDQHRHRHRHERRPSR